MTGYVNIYGLDNNANDILQGTLYLNEDNTITAEPDTPSLRALIASPVGFLKNRVTSKEDPLRFMQTLHSYLLSPYRRASKFIQGGKDEAPDPTPNDGGFYTREDLQSHSDPISNAFPISNTSPQPHPFIQLFHGTHTFLPKSFSNIEPEALARLNHPQLTSGAHILHTVGAPTHIPIGKHALFHVENHTDYGPGIKTVVHVPGEYGMMRTFYPHAKIMYNDVIETERNPSGGSKRPGLGTEIFAHQVHHLTHLGYHEIQTYGAGSPTSEMNGYYTWPRLGYNAHFTDVDRGRLARKYQHAQSIQDLLRMPGGQQWWQHHGFGKKMTFDLTPGSESHQILNAYLHERASRPGSGGDPFSARTTNATANDDPLLTPNPSLDYQFTRKGENIDLTPEENEALDRVWERLRSDYSPSSTSHTPHPISQPTSNIKEPTEESIETPTDSSLPESSSPRPSSSRSKGYLYLLHFSGGKVAGHAGHYLGWSDNPEERFKTHISGQGSPLVKAAVAQGLQVHKVKTWEGNRKEERRLKKSKNLSTLCPICRATHLARKAERQRRYTAKKKGQNERQNESLSQDLTTNTLSRFNDVSDSLLGPNTSKSSYERELQLPGKRHINATLISEYHPNTPQQPIHYNKVRIDFGVHGEPNFHSARTLRQHTITMLRKLRDVAKGYHAAGFKLEIGAADPRRRDFYHKALTRMGLQVVHENEHERVYNFASDSPITSNEWSTATKEAVQRAREASNIAYNASKQFPLQGSEDYRIVEGRKILSPRANARQYAALARSRSRIGAFSTSARFHKTAAQSHRQAARESLDIAIRQAHREAAHAHYQASRANRRASRMTERVGQRQYIPRREEYLDPSKVAQSLDLNPDQQE